ncbi:MAG: hypothetical protein AAF641_11775 [Pseudomonadota bacterium]
MKELNADRDEKAALESKVKKAISTEDDQIDKAYEALTINHSLGASFNWMHRFAQVFRRALPGPTENLKRVERLSTFSFLQRLAKTDIGMEVAKNGEDAALRALTMGFERYVAASNEVFRRHAQSATMILSFVFAIFLNINAIALFQHLVDNPQFSEKLIETGEESNEQSETALQKYNDALSNLETVSNPSEGAETSPEELEKILTEARQNLLSDIEKIDGLTSDFGLPIGWEQDHPFKSHCAFDPGKTCSIGNFFSSIGSGATALFTKPSMIIPSRATLEWIFGVSLAGFLIGLGGPFWYRVFTSLSNLLQILRTLKGEPRKEAIEEDKSSDQPASQELVNAVLRGQNSEGDDQKLMKIFRASTGLSLADFDTNPAKTTAA